MNKEIQKAIDELNTESIDEGKFNYSRDSDEVRDIFKKITGKSGHDDLDSNMFSRSKGSDDGEGEGWMLNVDDSNLSVHGAMAFVDAVMKLGKKKGWKIKQYGDDAIEIYESVNEATIAVQNAIDELSMINEKVDIDSPLSVTTFLTSQFKDSSRAKYEVEDIGSDKNDDSDHDVTVSWHIIKKGYAPSKGDIFIDLETGDWIDNYGSGKRFNNAKDLVSSIKKHIKSDAKSIHG